ncbi:MAG: PQQ-dependent sugar dehydrogenase [Gammaproteobacteria bacterium]
MFRLLLSSIVALSASSALAQQLSNDPFPTPIETTQDVISANFVEFAHIPHDADGFAPRIMHMVTEPGTDRRFASVMTGPIYAMNADGSNVTLYVDINDEQWGVQVMSAGNERGLQSISFHPQFNDAGTPGYGKFYTYTDTSNTEPEADFVSGGERRSHDTLLLEWTANNASASRYDGSAPKLLFRAAQPFPNHNASQIAFNPLAMPGDEDFGLLYVGLGDGGSGGDPMKVGQDLSNYFGKILRIDPLGNNSDNGHYGVPQNNPFADDNDANTLGEIYAYGVRNPQRFNWDSKTGGILLADIGQNVVEEISPVTAGANLGWSDWEGSYQFIEWQVNLENPRSDAALTWPVAEFDHTDPLFQRQVAVTGIVINRSDSIPALTNKVIFGDNPSGELLYIDADAQNNGGQAAIRRIMLNDAGTAKTFLQVIQETNTANGKDPASRADLRFGYGPDNQIYLLNKHDGVIRLLVP